MYAAIVTVTIDPDQADPASTMLADEIVPRVKGSPGFVAGYWLEPADGKGMSIVLFESEEQARPVAPPAGSTPAPGVTVDSVEFRPVAVSA